MSEASFGVLMSKAINFRLPDEDYAELERRLSDDNQTVSDAMKEMVRRFLGREVDPEPERIGRQIDTARQAEVVINAFQQSRRKIKTGVVGVRGFSALEGEPLVRDTDPRILPPKRKKT